VVGERGGKAAEGIRMQNTDAERVPASPVKLEDASELDKNIKEAGTDEVVLIQFTATWCRRCEVLKKEIGERFDAPLRWLLVDVEEIHELVERFSVVTMPRLDVYCGGKTASVESFDAKIENIVRVIEEIQRARPSLQLDDDF
jgi:thiol:disulfide interchange protein